MKFDQIIFAGDSAGGHLCYSVAYLALLRGFRPPDGIMAAYPAMYTDLNLSPSALLMIDDWLLSENFMNTVLMSLNRNGGNPSINPLASPLYAPNSLIRLLPHIVMLNCEGDSLRDGAFLMLLKIMKSEAQLRPNRVRLFYFKEYIHGFLNFDIAGGIEEYAYAQKIVMDQIQILFDRAVSEQDKKIMAQEIKATQLIE